jgi:hypothetical protein
MIVKFVTFRIVSIRIIELAPKGHIDKLMQYDDYIHSDDIKELRSKIY